MLHIYTLYNSPLHRELHNNILITITGNETMLDIYSDAKPGVSVAGFKIGSHLSLYESFVDRTLHESLVPWTVDLIRNNTGVLKYEFYNGCIIYFSKPEIELQFHWDFLIAISVGRGYLGQIYPGVYIGNPIIDIKHSLYLDETDDVHYLCDEHENIISGIYFVADGLSTEDNPYQIITHANIHKPR